jgi:hypothetical protein
MDVEFHAAKVTVPGRGEKWLYYNMQDEDDPNFRKVERHKKHILDGIEERQAWVEEVLGMNPYERRRREEARLAELEIAYGPPGTTSVILMS